MSGLSCTCCGLTVAIVEGLLLLNSIFDVQDLSNYNLHVQCEKRHNMLFVLCIETICNLA